MIRVLQHGTPCERSSWANQHDTRTWTHSARYQSGQMLQQRVGELSEVGAVQSNTWKRSTFELQQKEKNQEPKIETIRGTVNPADLMTKRLDGKRFATLCELLNIKRIDG